MRMWGTPLNVMCNAHMLGEHRELHMFVGALKACCEGRMRIHGHLAAGLLITTPEYIVQRHDDIVIEMRRRGMIAGYMHDTKMSVDDIPTYQGEGAPGFLDLEANLATMRERCDVCRRLQETGEGGWS